MSMRWKGLLRRPGVIRFGMPLAIVMTAWDFVEAVQSSSSLLGAAFVTLVLSMPVNLLVYGVLGGLGFEWAIDRLGFSLPKEPPQQS